jgi:PAS domain S-box-containing protein
MADLAETLTPMAPDAPGEVLLQRFEREPATQAVAVVDADSKPVGLIQRRDFLQRMAGLDPAVFALTPVSAAMDPSPRLIDAEASAEQVTTEMLAGDPAELARGFVVVEDGGYLGVCGAAALLKAASDQRAALARELAQARIAAQWREDSFHMLFDTNPVAMCVWDAMTLKIVAVNEAGLRQYGYTREQTLTLSVVDFMPEAERARLARLQREGVLQDTGESWRHIRSDGELLDVVLMVRPLHYEGRPARLAALIDITKRKRAEEELQRTRSFLDAVVENVPQVLVVKETRENRIVLVNRAGEKMFGKPREQILGKSAHDFFPADQANRLQDQDSAVLESSSSSSVFEETFNVPELGQRIVETKKLAVQAHPNEPPFLLVVSQDITEQKHAAELLAQARDEAEAANLAKSEFLANMSHEIRTPLNGVLGIAGVLGQTKLDERQREMVRIIETSAGALNALLSDILDIARVEAGQLKIAEEPFNLADTVREVGNLFRHPAEAKGLELETAIDARAEVMTVGDQARLKQILVNLVANAVKFTEAGGVRIKLIAETAGYLFEVEDTGVGFSMEQKDRLFGRFHQADGSITRRFGGSGLGLAISHSLADLMNGSLDAFSVPGEGSVFRLRLPLQAIAPVNSPSADEAAHAMEAGEVLRVLVADDHATNRRVVELIMAMAGAELVSVENGKEAVEAFQRQHFDVILMDMQMPVMDGLTAIREIRAHEAATGMARTPIIALTANAMAEHMRACLGAGADRHLAKPISPADLLDGVSELLDEYEAERPAAKQIAH